MNPFVGLSKVTKKRIDALENFTKEVEDVKNRLGDLESFAEKAGANFEDLKNLREKDEKREADAKNEELLTAEGETETQEGVEGETTPETETPPEGEEQTPQTDEITPEMPEQTQPITQEPIPEQITPQITSEGQIPQEQPTFQEMDTYTSEPKTTQPQGVIQEGGAVKFSDSDVDKIIEKSLIALNLDSKIDMLIDEFIENLKDEK
jgi:hypothetical protein